MLYDSERRDVEAARKLQHDGWQLGVEERLSLAYVNRLERRLDALLAIMDRLTGADDRKAGKK